VTAIRILVADDERVSRRILARTLEQWTFEVTEADDGEAAWTALKASPPSIAILDWMMPTLDGPELCRRIRQEPSLSGIYVLLLTARDTRPDLIAGLDAGADDYLIKPFDPEELRARVHVGVRVATLQARLAEQVTELQTALANVRQLRKLLPICSYCKRIRSDEDYWEQIESYVSQHSDTQFSHGICPSCMEREMAAMNVPPEERERMTGKPPRKRRFPWW
jgi:DNA-binding response OmpR family regulator